ncbi:hypothetical protein ASG35_23335 [Burkholderia sp. Leaf177]|nr:hypothetical protein ASG35_23335 [Burkholderia sp. Leaf177]
MSACPFLHFSLRSARCSAVIPAAGTGLRYTQPSGLRSFRGEAKDERSQEAGAVEPLVPTSGTAAFLFADAPLAAARRAVRAFVLPFDLQDATSKEPIEI